MTSKPLLLCLVASACSVDADQTATVASPLICAGVNCPGNGNVLGGLGPYELSMDKDKVSVRGFSFDRTAITYQPSPTDPIVPLTDFAIVGSGMQARRLGAPIAHWDMVGTRIPIHHSSGKDYVLRLTAYERGEYYDGTIDPFIDGYYIEYQEVGTRRWRDLCPVKDYDDARPDKTGTWAVFWWGDRYDAESGRIFASDAAVGDWFNISCSGDASLKFVRDKASGAYAAGIDPDIKQATLNMFMAKYCPDSPERYTHVGVMIDWSDKLGTNEVDAGNGSHEAIWTKDGAICLNRRRAPEDGELACSLPLCTSAEIDGWAKLGHLRSANVPQP